MWWHIFQHWRHVEISVWYHCIYADSVQSATRQEGKQSAVLVHKVCYHIYCDLENKETVRKGFLIAIILLRGSVVGKETLSQCLFFHCWICPDDISSICTVLSNAWNVSLINLLQQLTDFNQLYVYKKTNSFFRNQQLCWAREGGEECLTGLIEIILHVLLL